MAKRTTDRRSELGTSPRCRASTDGSESSVSAPEQGPLVSIIIASYNHAPYLPEAIESALAQTYGRIEVVLVDDGSTDESVSIARRYSIVCLQQANSGVSQARNRGAAACKGEYFVFLDSDDVLEPQYVAKCLARLDASASNVAYAYTSMRLFGAEEGIFASKEFSAELLRVGNYVHASALVRRSAFDEVGQFDPAFRTGYEDYDLWLRMLDHGYCGVLVPEPLLRYRRHAVSRNCLSGAELFRLKQRLMRRYPQLFWKDLAMHPLRSVQGWMADRGPHEQAEQAGKTAPPAWATTPLGISVLVVNWNSKDDLGRCLQSLDEQTDREFQAIVVDNGSSDGSADDVRARFPRVQVIQTGENLGFAEACNRGIEASKTGWIAILNNDATADPRWIEVLRQTARDADKRLGMIQSKIIFSNRPQRTNSTGVLMYDDGCAHDRDFDAPLRTGDALEDVFCASAGAAMYRRQALEEIRLPSGYFDRNFFMYFEDVDLGWRARLAGWSATYVPQAVVFHAFHGSSGRHGKHFVMLQCEKNRIRYMVKNASARFMLTTLPRHIGGLLSLLSHGGLKIVPELLSVLADSIPQRPLVDALKREDRKDIEGRWKTSRRALR